MGQPASPPAHPKTGRVTVFGPFIDDWPAWPGPFLASHMRAKPKGSGWPVLTPLAIGVQEICTALIRSCQQPFSLDVAITVKIME